MIQKLMSLEFTSHYLCSSVKKMLWVHNPQLQNFYGRKYFSIAKSNPLLDGITFIGGELFLQSEKFISPCKNVQRKQISFCNTQDIFLKKLLTKKIVLLLNLTGTLIDDPFILKERDLKLKFRGSKN